MKFNINVQADASSWPGGTITSSGLAAVQGGWHPKQIDYLNMLHTIGILTTPVSSTGFSLAEYWAQLRYLHAVDFAQSDLLLKKEYANLDSHQKTILSDDFGMGISMHWLTFALNIVPSQVCDGLYFINNMAGRFGARVAPKTNKRGPRKSPDFVAPDTNGLWHVIECKGTQSGSTSREKQFGKIDSSGVPVDGGRTQKATIDFPSHYAGEKLVAGVKIATVGSRDETDLLIVDPREKPILTLEDHDMPYAHDPVYRNTTSKILTLVGAGQLAAQVASPAGIVERPLEEKWVERSDFVQSRSERARDEFARLQSRTRQRHDGTLEVFREMETELSQPIEWAFRRYRRATVRYTCAIELLERAQDQGNREEPFNIDEPYWSKATRDTEYDTDLPSRDVQGPLQATAKLSYGPSFTAELILR